MAHPALLHHHSQQTKVARPFFFYLTHPSIHFSHLQWQLGYDAAVTESQATLAQAHAELRVSEAASQRQQAQAEAQHSQRLQQVRGGRES